MRHHFQIKRERVLAMKRQKEKRQEWIQNGHGEYEEIPEEKDFFEVSKKSESVVCHFYTDGNERCKVLLCTQVLKLNAHLLWSRY